MGEIFPSVASGLWQFLRDARLILLGFVSRVELAEWGYQGPLGIRGRKDPRVQPVLKEIQVRKASRVSRANQALQVLGVLLGHP